MSEENPVTPGNDVDDELQQALAAAFGDDAMDLLDEDGDDGLDDCVEMADESISTESTASEPLPVTDHLDADHTLASLMDDLAEAILTDHESLASAMDMAQVTAPTSSRNGPRFVLFALGDRQFGLPLEMVREIARCGKVTMLPRTPHWLRGLTNVRGQVLSVTDLRNLLQMEDQQQPLNEKIIVVRSEIHEASTAIVADRVLGIRNFPDGISDVSDLPHRLATLASGVAATPQGEVVLLNPDQILGSSELLTFSS